MVGQCSPQPLEVTQTERDGPAAGRTAGRVSEAKRFSPARCGRVSSSTSVAAPQGVAAFVRPLASIHPP
jgi:hypothetical protein